MVTLELSVGAGGGVLVQRFTREAPAPSRTSGAVRLGVALGGRVDLALGSYLFAEARGATYLYELETSADVSTKLARDVVLSVAGGMGWQF